MVIFSGPVRKVKSTVRKIDSGRSTVEMVFENKYYYIIKYKVLSITNLWLGEVVDNKKLRA